MISKLDASNTEPLM